LDPVKGEYLLKGINDVFAERTRQIEEEGYGATSDDSFDGGRLAAAGACYGIHAAWCLSPDGKGKTLDGLPAWWPMEPARWNPQDERTNLVKAAALIIAEIDRFDRKQDELRNQSGSNPSGTGAGQGTEASPST